ncbi:Pkinase-domain-containing protein [Rhizoclosmatium globosum]|uniref:Pkinase-domain-containing protein n=1 Tax=Rhizoclosmatium globosum TaxID=329046 RepID=A0A1Y2CVG7_9FUNG|nr:Pkinase-domain-containing protein [Rhizoclosmatium globosum]|eukprot:ORY51050.1 Pkinase-domain-containing protein [Rhizoclosmatium globosum]
MNEPELPVIIEPEHTESLQESGTKTRRGSVSFEIRNYSAIENATECSPASSPDSPDHKSSDPRAILEDFDAVQVIGRGAYGKVFLVRQKDTGDLFAMKVLKKATLSLHGTKTLHHTKSERQILSQLNHHFIVTLHYAFQTPTKLYLILQYAPGGDLFRYLAKEVMFKEPTAAFYVGEILLALEHLHELGIIYRDLKPENVLLDSEGHILLTDFGLSKVALETKTVCGTIEYMAPEILEESSSYGMACDYWSLGALMFDLLTGSPPFSGNNRKKVMEGILKKKPKFPKYLSPSATSLIRGLLHKDPEQRIGSSEENGLGKLNARELQPPIIPDPVDSILESFGKLGFESEVPPKDLMGSKRLPTGVGTHQ